LRVSEKEEETTEEDEECVTMCCHNGGHHGMAHGMGRKIFVATLGEGLEGRENVVMTRLNDDDLAKIDALVEVEVFKSRSEATAFFIREGINARSDLFEKVMNTVNQIKELKEKAKESLGKSEETQT
jgi:Arc/MetJ-type ribon-helix-helix transcriptional regulator